MCTLKGHSISLLRFILGLSSALALSSSAGPQDVYQTKMWNDISYQELQTSIDKGQYDKRSYLGLKLNNQLTVMLISDPETEKASVALDVKVGSYSDPDDLLGLAHLCEHMLFMGSVKYPAANDFRKYLNDRSGESNAFTIDEETVYNFSISPESLDGGLERFSQFFVAPLMDKSGIEGEIIIVDSEYKEKIIDSRKMELVQRTISNPKHPYSRFYTGNVESLSKIPQEKGIDVGDRLSEFYQTHYSANLMKLVVLGKDSLEELKSFVIPKFSKVKNQNIEIPTPTESPFTDEHLKIKINYVSSSNDNQMEIDFPLSPQDKFYEEKPTEFISNLLNYEGKGSIIYHLKQLGLASYMISYIAENSKSFALFKISIYLTSRGLDQQEKVLETVFAYIKSVLNHGITENLFNEFQANKINEFQFQRQSSSAYEMQKIAKTMQNSFPLSRILGSDKMVYKFNPGLIGDTLGHFNPDNMRITISSSSFNDKENLKKEPWVGGEYFTEPLPEDLLKKLNTLPSNNDMRLPEDNQFLTTDFSLETDIPVSTIPTAISNSSTSTLWHTGGNLKIPKASLNLMLKNNAFFRDIKKYSSLILLYNIVESKSEALSDMAQRAGYRISNQLVYPGLKIQVEGFTEKIESVLLSQIKIISELEITDENFQQFKQRFLNSKSILNSVEVLSYNTRLGLLDHQFTSDEIHRAMASLQKDDLMVLKQLLLSQVVLELLIVGNISIEKSKNLMAKVESQFTLRQINYTQKQSQRSVLMDSPSQWVYQTLQGNREDVNSEIAFYLDMAAIDNQQEHAMMFLISKIITEPLFDQLRSKEKLGYTVSSRIFDMPTREGLFVEMKSEKNPIFLESRIENFLGLLYKMVSNLTQSDIKRLIQPHLEYLTNKNKNVDLGILAYTYWDPIQQSHYNFNRDQELIDNLKLITPDQLIQFVHDTMLKDGIRRRKLSFHLVSHRVQPVPSADLTLDGCGEIITNLVEWNRRQALFPSLIVENSCSV